MSKAGCKTWKKSPDSVYTTSVCCSTRVIIWCGKAQEWAEEPCYISVCGLFIIANNNYYCCSSLLPFFPHSNGYKPRQKSAVSVSLLPAHALKLQIIAPTANCHALLWTQFLLADDSQWGAMTGSYCYSRVLCEFLQAPELFTTSPALAIPKAIASAGIEQSQVNFYYS